MLSLLVTLLLTQAGPRTDGLYVPQDVAPRIAANTYEAIDLTTICFWEKEVTISHGIEKELHAWRWTRAGLEVNGTPRTWKLQKDVVETDLRGSPERLVFLPGVKERDLEQRLNARHTAAFVKLAAGKWYSGPRTNLVITPKGAVTRTGRPGRIYRAFPCSISCQSNTVCATIHEQKWGVTFVPVDGGLAEVQLAGTCDQPWHGVEVRDGGIHYWATPPPE